MAYQKNETEVLKALGTKVQELRKQKTGLSQEKFALVCGLNRAYIASIERGDRNVSVLNLCRIAEALGVEPGILLRFKKPSLLDGTLSRLIEELSSSSLKRRGR
jgi:transcriptional regulator with XRE-family HTH domain